MPRTTGKRISHATLDFALFSLPLFIGHVLRIGYIALGHPRTQRTPLSPHHPHMHTPPQFGAPRAIPLLRLMEALGGTHRYHIFRGRHSPLCPSPRTLVSPGPGPPKRPTTPTGVHWHCVFSQPRFISCIYALALACLAPFLYPQKWLPPISYAPSISISLSTPSSSSTSLSGSSFFWVLLDWCLAPAPYTNQARITAISNSASLYHYHIAIQKKRRRSGGVRRR
jgi:hypothetical protein